MNYLKSYVAHDGNKARAAEEANVSERTYYRWFSQDQDFQLKAAELEQALFEEAVGRARAGSDNLLKFILQALNPQRFDSGIRKQIIANAAMQELEAFRSQQRNTIEADGHQTLESALDSIAELVVVDPYVDYEKMLSEAVERKLRGQ